MRKTAGMRPIACLQEADPAISHSKTRSYTFYQKQTDADKQRIAAGFEGFPGNIHKIFHSRSGCGTQHKGPVGTGPSRYGWVAPQWIEGVEVGACAGGVIPLGRGASPAGCAGGAGTPDFTLYASITCLVMLVPPFA